MKKNLLSALACASIFVACTPSSSSQTGKAEFFEPIAQTDLRLPSVPLVVSDPYFSIWSPFDKLTDGTTRHWTDMEKPLTGMLRVDGTTYRFMGAEMKYILEPIAPMTDTEEWEGLATHQVQRGLQWAQPDFTPSDWKMEKAAWGSDGPRIKSHWENVNTDLYVRREVEISAEQLEKDLYLIYSHDDVFELYLNGTEVVNTGNTWRKGVTEQLTAEQKALLHEGKNVIAAHCHNTTGGAYTDFGLFEDVKPASVQVQIAEQKSVDVTATSSYYTFACGPVELDVVFTAPMLIDDLDLLSAPMNYISYQVRSTDGSEHDVQFYLGATPIIALNESSQPTVSTSLTENNVKYVRTGTIQQPILAKIGDGICIDWGYFYMPAINGEVSLAPALDVENTFTSEGRLPEAQEKIICRKTNEMPALAYVHNFGKVQEGSSFTLLGYDEVEDIEYMYRQYKGYWAHDGKVSIFQMFEDLTKRYSSIMQDCRKLDQRIYDDGMAVGGKEYAEILSASYRHVIAAHKLFCDADGNLLFFSKENNSNGCVNTVDLTYPEAPLFLCYNPELQKAMMTSIFEYSYTGRWTKPFSAHDLGTYPKANGQLYGGDMPLEEAGNMITLAATLCMLDGNTSFVDKYWDVISEWANYLSENGQDPENQLCTDDFAGHWAHNCNLSLKAICGVAGYGLLAQMKGDQETADKYLARAKEMAQKWEEMAKEGDHYRLAFDRENTWSQKYNMIWDKIWNLNLFSDEVYEKEIAYYLTVQNKYGLPLDCRRDYTKSDWIMWTAGMSPDQETFQKFVTPVYNYINETESRVPISDWSDTKTGKYVGFKARSVIGGYWMRVFVEKMKAAQAE